MDLPLISNVSKGLIQSPGSLEAVFKQTSQDMFILMADVPFFVWRGSFLCLYIEM